MTRSTTSARWLLAIAGSLFLLYPATRPWHDETTAAGLRAATGSGWWIASHSFAMIGFVLLGLAFAAIRELLAETPGAVPAHGATLAAGIAVVLLLPYFGAETFGLHAAAQADVADPVALADDLRYQPVAVTAFALGWVALGAAGVFLAVAVARAGVLASRAGLVLTLGLLLFLPQFFGPPAVRIGHGVLVAAGCWILVAALLRSENRPGIAGSATPTT